MKLVYDVASCPQTLGIQNMVKVLENHRIVFWDSNLGGTKPKFYAGVDTADEEAEVKVVDLKGKEIDVEFYTKAYEEAEMWERELHHSKNSPIYYFTHYGTSEYPATQENISSYLNSLGLEQVVATDHEEAQKKWDQQRDKIKEAMKFVTIEHLKERKAVLDVLRDLYLDKVSKLEDKLKDDVRLFDSNNLTIAEKKRIYNLSTYIRKVLPVPEKFINYKTRKNKWDIGMLNATSYGTILEIANELRESKNR